MSETPTHQALGMIEVTSIARGHVVADAMMKKAPVALCECRPVSPGKFLVLVGGGVADVDEAFRAGLEIAGDRIVDSLFLAQAHAEIWPAARGEASARAGVESLGIVETATLAAALRGADASAKAARVRLTEMKLGAGLGGKAFYAVSGPLAEVEAALEAARGVLDAGQIVGIEIVAAPHEDLVAKLP